MSWLSGQSRESTSTLFITWRIEGIIRYIHDMIKYCLSMQSWLYGSCTRRGHTLWRMIPRHSMPRFSQSPQKRRHRWTHSNDGFLRPRTELWKMVCPNMQLPRRILVSANPRQLECPLRKCQVLTRQCMQHPCLMTMSEWMQKTLMKGQPTQLLVRHHRS